MEDFGNSHRTDEDYEFRLDHDEDYMNDGHISHSEEKELIYNENIGYNNIDKLFDDKSQEPEVFEIEFKIYDKSKKNVKINKLILHIIRCGLSKSILKNFPTESLTWVVT
jgi:hypothetical protein